MWALLLLACGEEARSFGDDCPSWEEAGAPMALTWCAPCHAVGRAGEARKGAPEGVDLETAEGIIDWHDAVAAAVQSGAMPPGGGPSQAEIVRFLDYLDCARSSDAQPLPAGINDAALLQGRETLVDVASDAEDPSLLVVWTTVVGGDADGRTGTWSAERYAVTETTAALVSRALYAADAQPSFEESWDPPLRVWDADAVDGWRVETNEAWTRQDDSGGGAQVWDITVGVVADADARLGDQAATEIIATLASGEDNATTELRWQFSPALSLVGWSWLGADEAGAAASEEHRQLTVAWPFEDLPGFPLASDLGWQGRLLRAEGP